MLWDRAAVAIRHCWLPALRPCICVSWQGSRADSRPIVDDIRSKIIGQFLDVGLQAHHSPGAVYAPRYPHELSGGQRQRVGIARAVAARPKILLMEEPFGAVDEITCRGLKEEIAALQKELKITVVFVTHDIHEAMRLGGSMLVMDEGRAVQVDTAEAIRREPASVFARALLSGRKEKQTQ